MEGANWQKSKKKDRNQMFDFNNGVGLVKFLNRIPNIEKIKFKLSEEEC